MTDPGHDPRFSFRAPQGLWDEASAIAARRGEPLSEVLRGALRRYIRRYGK